MNFDIYGNTLQPGFCEVHPHVREVFPCSQCLLERDREQQRQDSCHAQRVEYEKQERIAWLEELAHEAENIFGEIVGENDHDIIVWRQKYRRILPSEDTE